MDTAGGSISPRFMGGTERFGSHSHMPLGGKYRPMSPDRSSSNAPSVDHQPFNRVSLLDLFRLFAFIGISAFGGPAAHIALMQREAIGRRRLMKGDEFVDIMGLVNLIPGPNSTQMVMYVGYRQRGIVGMLIAGFGFIVPATLLTLLFSWAYVAFGSLPAGEAIMRGVQPVIVALIASAIQSLLPKAVINRPTGAIFAIALVAYTLGVNELLIIVAAGVIALIWFSEWRPDRRTLSVIGIAAPLTTVSEETRDLLGPTAMQLFTEFLKMAVVLYGSGYLLIAYMQAALVDEMGWLTVQQLMDVLAIGQSTPGPLLTTATAAGYVLGGWPGGIAATVGIFLPSFALIGLIGPRVNQLRKSQWGRRALLGINSAVVALLLAVSIQFLIGLSDNMYQIALALVAWVLMVRWQVNSMLLIGCGALIGFWLFGGS